MSRNSNRFCVHFLFPFYLDGVVSINSSIVYAEITPSLEVRRPLRNKLKDYIGKINDIL